MSAANGSAYGVGNCSFWMPIGGGVNQDVETLVQNTNTLQGGLSATAASGNLLTVATNTNGLQTGQVVQFTGSGVTGLTSGSAYFLYIASNTTVGFATSVANALAGTLITISGTPSSATLNFNYVANTVLTGGNTSTISAANVFSDAGHTVALNGMQVQQVNDVSGNSGAGNATQTNPALQPIFRSLGQWSDPDGATSILDFPRNDYPGRTQSYLSLPSSCEIGGGAVANEGTIIWAGRIKPQAGYSAGGNGSAGNNVNMYLFAIGNYSLQLGANSNITEIAVGVYPSTLYSFQKPMVIPDMNPVVMALRFSSASGTIGVSETKLYVGTNYTDTIASGNVLTGGTNSGYALSYNNANLTVPQELAEFIVFDRALTDAQIQTLIQQIQDRICGGFAKPAQVFYFGDSRTQGYHAGIAPAGDDLHRNWPMRASRRIGGQANWQINIAQSGNTVTMQQAAWNLISSVVDSTDFSNIVAIGEVGINDVIV